MEILNAPVASRKVILIVGNGMTLSFLHSQPALLDRWHSSRPFGFNVPTPGSDVPLLANLPNLASVVTQARVALPTGGDFEVFRYTLKQARELSGYGQNQAKEDEAGIGFRVEVESRHFLALAYSNFHTNLSFDSLAEWEWFRWFGSECSTAALHVISFNYDLIIERVLCDLGRLVLPQQGVLQAAQNHPVPGQFVAVFKPHGSINYDWAGLVAEGGYPLQNFSGRNDGPIRLLRYSELLQPRQDPLVVLPSEKSIFTNAMWNRQGFAEYKVIARQATHLVIVGFSYAVEDRREMNYFLDHLTPTAKVHLVDIAPSADLIEAIRHRGFEHRISFGPPSLDG